MLDKVKLFFAGGSTYFYLTIGIVVASMYGYISFLEARLDKVKLERDTAVAASLSKSAVVNSQNRQRENESKAKGEADEAKTKAADEPNPIGYAFEWVRERREQQRNSD